MIQQNNFGPQRKISSGRNGKSTNQAAKFVTGNNNYGSITYTETVKMGNSQAKTEGGSLVSFYKGLKASIPSDDLKAPFMSTRNQHPLTFHVRYARIDVYKHSFFLKLFKMASTISAEGSED